MAGESKSDNKLFQIIMVLITSIVAPVSVYYLTRALDTSPKAAVLQPTATLTSPVAGVSLTVTPGAPLITPTFQAEATTAEVAVPVVQVSTTPTQAAPGVQDPKGILPAGEVGIAGNIAVEVVSREVQVKDGQASLQVHLRNLSGQAQTLTYAVQSIAVKDANGRVLEVVYGEKREACTKKDLSMERKITLAPNQEVLLKSVDAKQPAAWCSTKDDLQLPLYKVESKEAPKSLVIEFNGFGLFKTFGFKIEF